MATSTKRASALVAAILALLSLLLVIRVSATAQWLRVALDASHGPIFACVAVLLALLLPPTRRADGADAWPDWPRYLKVLALCVALGALIEFLQGFEGRPPSFFDVMTDTAGALVGLALWAFATRIRARKPASDPDARVARGASSVRLWSVIALGLAGLTFILWRPMQAAGAYTHRAAIFPAIVEFEVPVDLYFTSTDWTHGGVAVLPEPWSRKPGERAFEMRYDPGHPPAFQILEPGPDWRRYGVIAVDLTNAGPVELSLVLRIHDAHHDWSHEDRLNLPFVIPPRTRTTLRVSLEEVAGAPASRRMDMARIANVMVFGQPPAGEGRLYLTRIWLE